MRGGNSNDFLFVSYYACIWGFMSGCRPLLGLDGTHLKGKYLSIFLGATGIDADGALFPLAFGIVDAENHENWVLVSLTITRIVRSDS
jgi:MULE transposase domain